jgi:hypothetical protein
MPLVSRRVFKLTSGLALVLTLTACGSNQIGEFKRRATEYKQKACNLVAGGLWADASIQFEAGAAYEAILANYAEDVKLSLEIMENIDKATSPGDAVTRVNKVYSLQSEVWDYCGIKHG